MCVDDLDVLMCLEGYVGVCVWCDDDTRLILSAQEGHKKGTHNTRPATSPVVSV